MPSLTPSLVICSFVHLLTFDVVRSKTINSFAGPYIAFGHTFDPCPSDGRVVVLVRPSHFNPARPYDRQTLSGNVTSAIDIKDNIWTRVDMAVRSNNQWKENAFIFNFPNSGCSALRDHIPDLFRVMAKYVKASTDKNTPCRMPAGQFVLKNDSVNWTFPNFKVMPYGRYRFRVQSRPDSPKNPVVLCLEVDAEIIPKP